MEGEEDSYRRRQLFKRAALGQPSIEDSPTWCESQTRSFTTIRWSVPSESRILCRLEESGSRVRAGRDALSFLSES